MSSKKRDQHVITIEHLHPWSDGGKNTKQNLRLAGMRCNSRVKDLPLEIKLQMKATWYSSEWTDYAQFFGRVGTWVRGPLGKVWKDAPGQKHPREYDYNTAWSLEKQRRKSVLRAKEARDKIIRIQKELARQRMLDRGEEAA